METFPRILSSFIYRLDGFCQCLPKKAQMYSIPGILI